MLPSSAMLSLLLAVPSAALPAQVAPASRADVGHPDSAVRLVAAAYVRATTASAAVQVPLLHAALRLADSVLAAAPAPPTAARVYRLRGYAALSLSRELRGVAGTSGRCADALAARAEAASAADGLLADVGPQGVAQEFRITVLAGHLVRAEEDSTARLVGRLCPTASR